MDAVDVDGPDLAPVCLLCLLWQYIMAQSAYPDDQQDWQKHWLAGCLPAFSEIL